MGLRVSRQAVDVIGQRDSDLRVATQAIEVLGTTDPNIEVYRVAVEYLRVLSTLPSIKEVSATSTLVLSQDEDVEYIELPKTNVTLAMTVDAAYTLVPVKEGDSTLVLTQAASYERVRNRSAESVLELLQAASYVGPKWVSANSAIPLTQAANFAQTYEVSAESTLVFSQDAIFGGTHRVDAESILALSGIADTKIKTRAVTTQLNLTHVATVDKILTAHSHINLTHSATAGMITRDAESQLNLTQSARFEPFPQSVESQLNLTHAATVNIKSLSASSHIDLSQDVACQKPIRASGSSNLSELGWVVDPITGEVTEEEVGLRHEATVVHDSVRSVEHLLSFRQTVGLTHVRADGDSVSASSTLSLTHSAIVNKTGYAGNIINLMHEAKGWAGRPGNSHLELTHEATVVVSKAYTATSTIGLSHAATYTLITASSPYQYTPYIGESTDPDAPTPPTETLQGPMAGIQVPFQLVYPSIGAVTDAVSMKTPNLGNIDRLAFNRVQRETRGGTLIVFADAMWPKVQSLLLTFSGLKSVEAQAVLTFIDDHLGREIGLIDWEHRYWRGVITVPDDPIVEDSFDSFTASFEFQGELDPTWNPQVVPPSLRYSKIRSDQEGGYYVPTEPILPITPEAADYHMAEAGATIKIGYPLYLSGNIVNPAQANAAGTTQVVGISIADVSVGVGCKYITEGSIERSDWMEVAGTATLSPGVTYYLSPDTAGRITATAPTTAGQYVVRVGRAVNTTTLDVEIELPILL